MTLDLQQRPYDWREKTVRLEWKLERAHLAMEDLGSALDEGDDVSTHHVARSAHEAVGSAAQAVKTLRAEQPPTERLNEPDAIGSTLAIGGSGVATIALDVMVNAIVALAATDNEDDTDFLIGACMDAESAYEVSTAVVQAASRMDGPAMLDLQRAFETEGGVALRKRVTMARPRVREITKRIRGQVPAEH
ncbi:MAG TPA: hypothetical protein VII76_08380 [Acidimicrobiales bacterium]